jgi:drug/metabolite transporter (DMT)-like permease
MILHTPSARWRLGCVLAFSAALQWGLLPIVLKVVLGSLDAYTVTWCRFSIAAVLFGGITFRRNGLPGHGLFLGTSRWLLVLACVGLCANYVLYVVGLQYVPPSTAAVVIQLAPIFMLLGGLVIFRETFTPLQWVGFVIMLCALMLFFNERLSEMFGQLSDYTLGVSLLIAAATAWGVYALAQKQLLQNFPSETIMFIICLSGAVVFAPFIQLAPLLSSGWGVLLLLFYCGVNTLIAYWCFAEALEHWEASRVSAVLSTTPLFTVICGAGLAYLFPGAVEPDTLNLLSIIGAILVVAGSMMCALGRSGGEPKILV